MYQKDPVPMEQKRRSKIKEQLLNLIYPKTCGICGKGKDTYLCKKCENRLKTIAIFGKDEYLDKNFENHYYIFKYDNIIRKLIIDYKFNEKAYIYRSFSNFLNKNKEIYSKLYFYDIIMPVPISKKRKKTRGYNQSNLLAKEIAEIYSLKLESKTLIKCIDNIAQSTLDKNGRGENVIGAYKVKDALKIIDKKILLIDDIFTTGATVEECSKMLKIYGAEKIDILTIAKD